MTAIDVRDLFRVHRTSEGDAAALQGLTLTIAHGETVVVLGPSGAGKSSLLRVLGGLEPPSAGVARVLGADLGRLSARRRAAFRQAHVGLIDQHYDRALAPALTARAAVALPLALRGVPRREREARAAALLERVGLAERGGARPAELSGGERQRVAVCAAIAHRPGVLLADEPGGELDAAGARAVYRLIGELARDEGATVVLVSHDATASEIADRTVRLRDGRISDESVPGADALVVGRGGWVRLPEELLGAAGLGTRLRPRAEPGAIVLEAAGGHPPPAVADAPGAPDVSPLRVDGADAELRGVRMAYGKRRVLDGLDARLEPGRLTVVSGRSGSGKSTVLRLLAGLAVPDAGEVVVAGEPLAGRSRAERAALRRRAIALVAQDTGLADLLSARENVVVGLAVRGVPDAEAGERADAWLAAVGLADRARQRVHRLSAGERQRAAIARALAAGPRLLLVDEPTSRLDEASAAAIGDLLAAAAHVHGATVVCATHEPQLIARADVEVRL